MTTRAPMLRSRQAGRNCRIHGHPCEVSLSRQVVTRTQERRTWRRELEAP